VLVGKPEVSTVATTVLIVDEDLAFVFWLGRLLNKAGYQVWPARNGHDAAALLKELDTGVDLLVINSNSCGAAALIEDQRRRTNFKIIALQAQDEGMSALSSTDVTLVKPRRFDELSEFEWMGVIERVLAK
jgi:DNA-binding response OmpR family regulator